MVVVVYKVLLLYEDVLLYKVYRYYRFIRVVYIFCCSIYYIGIN